MDCLFHWSGRKIDIPYISTYVESYNHIMYYHFFKKKEYMKPELLRLIKLSTLPQSVHNIKDC